MGSGALVHAAVEKAWNFTGCEARRMSRTRLIMAWGGFRVQGSEYRERPLVISLTINWVYDMGDGWGYR